MKLNFETVTQLLPDYVNGALPPEKMLAVDAFIRQQKIFVEQLTSLEESLSTAPMQPVHPPAGIKRNLMEIVTRDHKTDSPSRIFSENEFNQKSRVTRGASAMNQSINQSINQLPTSATPLVQYPLAVIPSQPNKTPLRKSNIRASLQTPSPSPTLHAPQLTDRPAVHWLWQATAIVSLAALLFAALVCLWLQYQLTQLMQFLK